MTREHLASRTTSVAVAIGAAAVSFAMYGPAAWRAFLASGTQAAKALAEGRFPMSRMSSVYAAALNLGTTPTTALAVHVAAALAAALACGTAALRRDDRHVSAGLMLGAACLVSPYAYDYDLATLSVAAALLADRPPLRGATGIALLAWSTAAGAAGFAWWTNGGKGGVAALLLVPLVILVSGLVGLGTATTSPAEA